YEVTDEVYNNDSGNSWEDDAVDLYIDGLNEKNVSYDANDAQFEMSWGDATYTFTGNAVGAGLAAGAEYRYADVSGGYTIEARIPWSNFGTLAVPGTQFGIDFMVNDGDLLGNVRDTKLSWYSMVDQAWQNPSLFATAQLVGGEGQILTAHFTIGGTGPFLTETPVSFDASQSVAPGSITSYAWDFGDGSTGEGVTVDHSYTTTGSFTVTLTITDDTGATRSASRSISVIDGLGTPEKPLPIPLTDTAPTIDGVMDGIWSTNASSVKLFNVINETVALGDPATDLLPTVYVMWDANNIYVFYDIVDDVKVTGEASDSWRDDDAEFFLDTDNSKTQSAHDANDAQFSIRLNDPVMTGDAVGRYPSTQFATAETANGWALEMAVPWSDVGATVSEGSLIGIEFQVNDDDTNDDRDHKVAWFGTEDNAWQWAHLFGTAVLTGPLVVGTEEEEGLPNRFAIESVYPNPFNPTTTALVAIRQPGQYEVRVFNVLGQLIEKKNLEVQTAGRIELPFDFGSRASGIYLISIKNKISGQVVTARATLVK
ncbi:MAG TPA: sugar-binding protein, partial [Rhodothermales bacterium]